MLKDLIPAPYRWLVWLAVVIVIAAAGAWGGHETTAAYYRPKVKKAEARATEFESAYDALALASRHQNEAIAQWQADAKEREEHAAKAVAQARAFASVSHDTASNIMGLKLPAGANECIAAREAFDEELQQERGKR